MSADKGPLIIFGQRPPVGSGGSENPNLGPSLVFGGWGIIDPRAGYNTARKGAIGWFGGGQVSVLDYVPSTISTTAIAAAQIPVAGTPLTLANGTGGVGITALAAPLQVWPSGNVIPGGTLVIDGAPALLSYGMPNLSTGTTLVSMYDPRSMGARALQITSVGNDSGATFLVSGADVYGYPLTQLVTGATAGANAKTLKALKFIFSITPAGALSGSNVSVGQSDIYGLPILASTFGYVDVFWNSAVVTAQTGFVAPDTTSPATNLTGDVRGTYALQAASNNTLRLQVFVQPSALNLSNSAPNGVTAGLFGVPQV